MTDQGKMQDKTSTLPFESGVVIVAEIAFAALLLYFANHPLAVNDLTQASLDNSVLNQPSVQETIPDTAGLVDLTKLRQASFSQVSAQSNSDRFSVSQFDVKQASNRTFVGIDTLPVEQSKLSVELLPPLRSVAVAASTIEPLVKK